MKTIGLILIGLIVLWIVGEATYSSIISRRMARWEATLQFDEQGVRRGCRACTTGRGRAAVLLVHGFNTCPAIFHKLAPALAERGFTVRAMRLPAFARRTSEYATTTAAEWRAAVASELGRLRKDHERVYVIGQSLGAAVLIDVLSEQPQAAAAAVLLAPAIEVSSERSPLLSPRAWHKFGNWTMLTTRYVESPFGIDARSAEAREFDLRHRFVPRAVTDEFFAVLERIDGKAADYRTSTLMLLARHDKVVDNSAAEAWLERSAAEHKEVQYLEESGHAVSIDNNWRDAVEAADRFFDSVRPTAAAGTP